MKLCTKPERFRCERQKLNKRIISLYLYKGREYLTAGIISATYNICTKQKTEQSIAKLQWRQ